MLLEDFQNVPDRQKNHFGTRSGLLLDTGMSAIYGVSDIKYTDFYENVHVGFLYGI